ncbi:MAG: hypothetical protein ACOZQL_20965 [Myxococcota bacterium]
MHTLLVVSLLLTASPKNEPARDAVRAREARAARLMTAEEVAQLGRIDARLRALKEQPDGVTALRATSLTLLGLGVLPPAAMAGIGLVVSFLGGLGALFTGTMWGPIFTGVFHFLFVVLVPPWVWAVCAGATLLGGGLVALSFLADAPRQREAHALRQDRRALLNAALARDLEPPLSLPPLLTF